jgi:PAS domain S-box-containing protein
MSAAVPDSEFYRDLFVKHPAIKLLIDPEDGRIVDANDAACAFYGLDRDTLRDKLITDINELPAEDVRAHVAAARSRQRDVFLFRHRLARGDVRVVEAHSGPVPIGGRALLLSVIHDVTARVQLEAQLKRRFEVTADSVCVLDAVGIIQRCNPAFQDLLGRGGDELIGRKLLDFCAPEDVDKGQSELRRCRESSQVVRGLVLRLLRQDGQARCLDWTITWDATQRLLFASGRDVTSEQTLEQQLRAEHEKLLRAQQLAHLGSWDWIVGEETADWSDEAYRIFGREAPPAGPRITYSTFLDHVHPGDRPAVRDAMAALARRHVPFDLEYRLVRPDGTERVVHSHGEVVAGLGDGRPRVIGTVLDITERKAIEAELRQQRALLDGVLNSSHDGVMAGRAVRDASHRIVDFEIVLVNAAGARLLNRPAATLVGSTMRTAFPGHEATGLFDQYVAVVDGAQPLHTEVRYDDEGVGKWLRLLAVKFEDGFACTISDISQQKTTEDALRESEHRFRAIADFTYDWESWIDSNRELLWVNPAVQRMTGYRVGECLQMRDYPLPMIHADDQAEVARLISDALAGGSGNDVPLRICHRSGAERWGAMSYQPIYDGAGLPRGFRASVRDITDRKQHEQERERLVTDLRGALARVKTLHGLLPICAGCKKIRNDEGYWERIEVYIREHSDAEFSHGVCPECARRLYPDVPRDASSAPGP